VSKSAQYRNFEKNEQSDNESVFLDLDQSQNIIVYSLAKSLLVGYTFIWNLYEF